MKEKKVSQTVAQDLYGCREIIIITDGVDATIIKNPINLKSKDGKLTITTSTESYSFNEDSTKMIITGENGKMKMFKIKENVWT